MLKMPIVLLLLFDKQCSSPIVLFLFHCLTTMLKTPIVLLLLCDKLCSKFLLFYCYCLRNKINPVALLVLSDKQCSSQVKSSCSKHDVMFV